MLIALNTPDVAENIARPVAMQIIRQMVNHVKLPAGIAVRYIGGGGALPVVGSTLDDVGSRDRLPTDTNITIDVDDEYDEDRAASTVVFRQENPVCFDDRALNIYIKPNYNRIKASITVKYSAPDKTSAQQWRTAMKRRANQLVMENLHTVDYHYPIPPAMLAILFEIHRLRELQAGYGQTFGAYIKEYFKGTLDVITNQAGNNPIVVIRETQARVIGRYDFTTQPPKPERDNDSGVWSVSFNYNFWYDRCEDMTMQYPMMVHNQVLSATYRNDIRPYELEDFFLQYPVSLDALSGYTYEERTGQYWKASPGIPIPYFDDWLPRAELPKYQCLFRILNQVNPANLREIVTLTNLGSWQIKPSAIPYMRDHPIYLAQPYESIFSLRLMRGQTPVPMGQLLVTQDLDVFTIDNMDLRGEYHLLISLLTDLRMLSPDALRRLCRYGDLVVDYFASLYPNITPPVVLPDGSVSLDSLQVIIRNLPFGTEDALSSKFGWFLVGQFVIYALGEPHASS